jgi:hypothetical protein
VLVLKYTLTANFDVRVTIFLPFLIVVIDHIIRKRASTFSMISTSAIISFWPQ